MALEFYRDIDILEEKEIVCQIKKCEENFLAGWRALASDGGAERSNFTVRILFKESLNIVQKTPPKGTLA